MRPTPRQYRSRLFAFAEQISLGCHGVLGAVASVGRLVSTHNREDRSDQKAEYGLYNRAKRYEHFPRRKSPAWHIRTGTHRRHVRHNQFQRHTVMTMVRRNLRLRIRLMARKVP